MRKLVLLLIMAGAAYWIWQGSPRLTQSLHDATLTAHVLVEIAKSEPLELLSVRVSADRGTVEIGGHVRTDRDEEKLLNLIRRVNGVEKVRDRLALDERLRSQQEIEQDLKLMATLKKDLIQEEGLRGMAIHVEVKQGRVVMTGQVPLPEQARLAEEIAKSVKGVREVENHIQVKIGTP